MKRVAAIATGVVILALGFYGAWPAWSGYVIRNAIQNQDPDTLARKVDFDQVKVSLRPFVAAKAEEGIGRYQSQLGGAGAIILEQLKKDAIPKLIDASLRALLTPEAIIKIASEAGPIKENIDKMMREQAARRLPQTGEGGDQPAPKPGLGGILGKVLKRDQPGEAPPAGTPAPAPTPPAAGQPKPRYSLANIKSFSFNGPLSFRVGVAKNAAAADPDVTAEMSFTGFDWKLTGLYPRQ